MKRFPILAVASIALLLCSCQKEELNGRIFNNWGNSTESSADTQPSQPLPETTGVQYGALINAPSPQNSADFQVSVANKLGISCLRSRVMVPNAGNTAILNSGYKVVLNFNSDYEGTALPFVTNLVQYKADLTNIVAGFTTKPVVAVIENEESNVMYYYGTAQEYINQLNTAISVMHNNGIKVSNGGITDEGLNYLVYQDFMQQGKEDSAQLFKQLVHVTPRSAATQERGAFVNTLLQAYAKMNLDFVNFHWKATSSDTQAFLEVVTYLKKVTGKPVISNELGQFDTDPNTLLTHIQACTDAGFPYVLWYSPDENSGKKATPLQHSDASLTSTGIAYRDYLD